MRHLVTVRINANGNGMEKRGQAAKEVVEETQRKISGLALKLAKEGKIILPTDDAAE